MKGKALRKHSLREKTAASALLKLFISSNEWCHTTDALKRMSGTPFSNVNNIHVHSMIPEDKKNMTICGEMQAIKNTRIKLDFKFSHSTENPQVEAQVFIIQFQDFRIPKLSTQFSTKVDQLSLTTTNMCTWLVLAVKRTCKQNSNSNRKNARIPTWYMSPPSLSSVNLLCSVRQQCKHTYQVCFTAVLEQCKLAVLGKETMQAYIPGMFQCRPWAV